MRDFWPGQQIKAARALLAWTVPELAAQSGVSAQTIRRLEHGQKCQLSTLIRLEETLITTGITFIGDPADSCIMTRGVQISTKS